MRAYMKKEIFAALGALLFIAAFAAAQNSPPVILPIYNKVGHVGMLMQFSISAIDPDTELLQFSTIELPGDATFTDNGNKTGTFIWPSPLVGNHPVTFYVTDGESWDDESVILNITDNCCEHPGDANNTGVTAILDVTYIIAYLYKSGPTPPCPPEADVNADGVINILDVTRIIGFMYGLYHNSLLCGP